MNANKYELKRQSNNWKTHIPPNWKILFLIACHEINIDEL